MFDKVVFAGGGHRGWWQAGFWDRVGGEIELHPRVIAGVSFGAVIACLLHAGDSRRALNWYERELKALRSSFNPLNLLRRDRLLPSAAIHRKALRALLGGDSFRQLMWRAPEIRVQYARLPEGAHPSRAVLGALLLPRRRRAGLVTEAKRIQDCRSERELVDLLAAATCAPPFTAAETYDGAPCVDAGLVDELQLAAVADVPGHTLVLGTRHDPSLAPVFARDGCVHVQPSEKVPVGRWDYSSAARFQKAYDLGRRDGEAFLRTFALGQYCDPAAPRLATVPAGQPAGLGADAPPAGPTEDPARAAAPAAGGVTADPRSGSADAGSPFGEDAKSAAAATPGAPAAGAKASPAEPAPREPEVAERERDARRPGGSERDPGSGERSAGRIVSGAKALLSRPGGLHAAPPLRASAAKPDAAAEADLFPPMHAIDDEGDDGGVLDVSAKLAAYREAAAYKEPTDAGMADDLRASQAAASDGQLRSGRSLRASNT